LSDQINHLNLSHAFSLSFFIGLEYGLIQGNC